MNQFLRLANLFVASRKLINGVYFVVPPVGLLFMYLSPSFTTRERAVRTAVTASFLAFFMAMGPELQSYLNSEMTRLAMQ
jgi:hypothetical protein